MNALNQTDFTVTDERRTHVDPRNTAHRRLNDNRLNTIKWPALVWIWAVGGAALLISLIYMAVN